MAKSAKQVEIEIRPPSNGGAIVERLIGLPAHFNPDEAKPAIETLKAAVDYAARMKLWDDGLKAAELMVELQRLFVGWWNVNVRVRKSAGSNQHKRSSADLRTTTPMAKAEAQTGIKNQQVSRWRTGLARPDYANRIFNAAYKKAMADKDARRADLQTGEMEWFTPSEYVEKVRAVLGKIDLDPASCKAAQATVKAKKFFTAKQDGLKQDWKGAVFLNPPYAGALIAAFAAKLLEEIGRGNVAEAIMLTNGYTETSWFHNLAQPCRMLCFTRGRIKFVSPHGEKSAPTNGQCFFYFGPHADRFVEQFADVGLIMTPVVPGRTVRLIEQLTGG